MAEKHLPAPNDIINTSFGGIVMGEMTARLSNLILSKQGKPKSSTTSTVALLVNPIQGFNRILDKEWGKQTKPSSCDANASLVIDCGMRVTDNRNDQSKPHQSIYGRMYLQYGDPYSKCKTPFSNFSLITEFGNDDSSKVNVLQIEGSLFGKTIKESEKNTTAFNITMNYDYLQNAHFVYGAQGIRTNLFSKYNISKNIQLQLKAGAGIITLAAVPNTYMYYGEGRNYDYCSGVSFHVGAGLNLYNKVFFTFNSNAAETMTVNGYKSSHLFHNTRAELRVVLYKHLTVTASNSNYYFNGYYKNYANVYEHLTFGQLGLGYRVAL
jgi:hypothetical protein